MWSWALRNASMLFFRPICSSSDSGGSRIWTQPLRPMMLGSESVNSYLGSNWNDRMFVTKNYFGDPGADHSNSVLAGPNSFDDHQRGRRSHAPRDVSQHRSGRPAPSGGHLSSAALPSDVRWERGLFLSGLPNFRFWRHKADVVVLSVNICSRG